MKNLSKLLIAALLFCHGTAYAQINSVNTVTPIHTGCQASGGDVIVGGQTISTIVNPTTLSASNAPILAGYCGGAEFFSNGTADAPTIAVAGSPGFPVGWMTYLCNVAAFNRTVTPASGTIGGNATYLLVGGTPAAPQCIQIVSDGVSDYKILGGLVSSTGTNLTNGTSTIAGGTTTRILFDNAGVLGEYVITGTGNVVMSASPTMTGTVTLPSGTITSAGYNNATALGIGAAAPTSGENIASASAASLPALLLNGAIFTGGTGTTTFPHFLIQPTTSTASVAWNTSGTALGVNAHTGTGNLIDLELDGSSKFSVSASSGSVTLLGNILMNGAGATLTAPAAGQILFSGRWTGTSPAAATLQLGAAAAASPVAQTVQGQGSRPATDSNVGGGNVTVTSGNGTGTGTLSSLILQSPVAVGSGTGAQTMTTGLTISGGTAVMKGYTVATLPAAATQGAHAFVTDAVACTFLATLTGGGATFCPVSYNGTAWVAG